MAKLKVYTTKGYPFYCHEDSVLIGSMPVEVHESPWLAAQIEAGLIAVAEKPKSTGKKADKPNDTDKPDETNG